MEIGQIISGDFGEIAVRQKSGENIELGELVVADTNEGKIILEVFDLVYGSQIGELSMELIAGMKLEGYENLSFMDENITNYTIAKLKPLLFTREKDAKMPKSLPKFFSSIRKIEKNDLNFMSKPQDAMLLGKIRSGSKMLDFDACIAAKEALRHHILVTGTTGRGKSKLISLMAWSLLSQEGCSMLILDPHDEYFGRSTLGLKDHEKGVSYYSLNPMPGGITLKINIKCLRPHHFEGVLGFSEAQNEAMYAYYNEFNDNWVRELVLGEECETLGVRPETLAVLQRKFNVLLGIRKGIDIECRGVFDDIAGKTTIADICNDLENGRSVIVDTSLLPGDMELVIGSMLSKEILRRYKGYKLDGSLDSKPIVSVVLEEAPRVLNNDALQSGNIFTTIAREGRKFGIGLIAITQLPSLIPKEILANMNTKIIFGTELAAERAAVIESAAQDLSKDDRNIASLDRGEAIVTSTFTKFAVPLSVPLFDDYVKTRKNIQRSFGGMI